ncbi:putative selenate ABC transporter substrate-binding protein [Moorena sp. SIO3B2]|uniref:putative selenate ABC transporter substrate-binding protein n=1 Tax=Moorena sp. SIO3B2 TaxID=2607827 RepID=UPI0013C919E1|nr:putative selenate ABC transporter substrate-binding protein [Moorena sp. SIO3B2]NEP36982.1 putative selenate ABC transporter substrate-binding protein [Moorena sp. SIO3B2]
MNKKILLGFILVLLLPVTACSPSSDSTSSSGNGAQVQSFTTGAIPDQDPEKLQRLYGKLAAYLEAELKVPVEYKPVIDYAAAVTAFRVGDLDLVWFGGLTGVQARLQVEEAEAIAQRDIDAEFHTVFIANKSSGIKPIKDIKDLKVLKGHTLTFGSESSTSGRLMPQYFLEQAGVTLDDFQGEVGFSKSHDATIQLVEAGSYKVGALNEQVWKSRVAAGNVDLKKVELIWRTPAYYDYHWVINPKVKERYGDDFVERVQAALLKLDPNVPEQKQILDLFGATKFISTKNDNYSDIEAIGRKIGKIK